MVKEYILNIIVFENKQAGNCQRKAALIIVCEYFDNP